MQLVDEQDDFALSGADLVHDCFEPLFELAAKAGAGDHRAHVERENALVGERVGGVAVRDALGDAFGDGGLAHARAADERGVVLRPAHERLHHARDFGVAPDDGVEHPVGGERGEVDAESLQRLVPALGAPVGDAMPAARLQEGGVNLLVIYPERPQNVGSRAGLFPRERDEQMLGADEVVLHPIGFLFGARERGFGSGRRENLIGVLRERGHPGEARVQPRAHRVNRRADLAKNLGGDPPVLLQQRHEDMLGVPLAVSVAPRRHFLRNAQRVLRLLGEVVGT